MTYSKEVLSRIEQTDAEAIFLLQFVDELSAEFITFSTMDLYIILAYPWQRSKENLFLYTTPLCASSQLP
jgi:hypothetical protein